MGDLPTISGREAYALEPGHQDREADGGRRWQDTGPGDPALTDPHMGIDGLLERLPATIRAGRWLDAFLLAAGGVQLVEDAVQGTSWMPRRLLDHLASGSRRPAGRMVLSTSRRCLDVWTDASLNLPPRRGLCRWCAQAAALTERLAERVVEAECAIDTTAAADLARDAERLASGLRHLPGAARLLVGQTVRQPSCFRSFDLHPADVLELVRRFAERHPRRERPLLVLGVRTSGSHLAPIAGAALRRLGYRDVVVGTTRPGMTVLPGRSAAERRVREARGAVLLLDDPPVTGSAMATVARRVERSGFPTDSVVPLVPVFADGTGDDTGGAAALPQVLDRYACLVLPGQDWAVRARLRPQALAAAVTAALPSGHRLTGLEAGAQGALSRWAHLSVPVDARVADDRGGVRLLPMVAEWTGVGYLGRRAAVLGDTLTGLVPATFGFADGVLLRERLPGEDRDRGDAAGGEATVPALEVARYVAARHGLLAADRDRSLSLAGRQPVWEVAARALAPGFGRLSTVAGPVLLSPVTRVLLTADRPGLVDGRADAGLWFADADGRWAKTRYADGTFSNLDLASYDPLYDLAGAGLHDEDGGAALIDAYRTLTGTEVSAARWCLLTLVHGWNAVRLAGSGALPPEAAVSARRAQARAVQHFLARTYLADLDREPEGPWCVLDVDGVLETDVAGFAASSPLGMLALRALRAHGYRTLLATGRSLPEVRDRRTAYRLPGGVAEYGAVVVSGPAHQERVLPLSADSGAGQRLAARLAALPDVRLDPLFQYCLRASLVHGGRRTGLPESTVSALLAEPALNAGFTPVPGDAQTDFVPRGVDKVLGVRRVLAELGEPTAVPALAVGDGVADLELLRWARRGVAPGNAAAAVRAAGVPVLRQPYQSGLVAAVAPLIGHRPGSCPVCRVPRPDRDAGALLAILAVPESGRAAAAIRIARLAGVRAAHGLFGATTSDGGRPR